MTDQFVHLYNLKYVSDFILADSSLFESKFYFVIAALGHAWHAYGPMNKAAASYSAANTLDSTETGTKKTKSVAKQKQKQPNKKNEVHQQQQKAQAGSRDDGPTPLSLED